MLSINASRVSQSIWRDYGSLKYRTVRGDQALVVSTIPHGSAVIVYCSTGTAHLRGLVTLELQAAQIAVIGEDDLQGLTVTCSNGSAVILCLPRSATSDLSSAVRHASGSVWPAHIGTPHLVAHLLDGIATQPAPETLSRSSRLTHHITAIVALMCSDVHERAAQPYDLAAEIIDNVKDYIEVNLTSTSLGPKEIARAHSVSTRTLQRAFASTPDTVTSYIRARRLERVSAILRDPTRRSATIQQIGAECGFVDYQTLIRHFRTTFGVSPSAYRKQWVDFADWTS